jgi:hypothetical protein
MPLTAKSKERKVFLQKQRRAALPDSVIEAQRKQDTARKRHRNAPSPAEAARNAAAEKRRRNTRQEQKCNTAVPCDQGTIAGILSPQQVCIRTCTAHAHASVVGGVVGR